MADDIEPASFNANIFQRMHAVMQEIKYVQKEKKQGMRYSIVSHDAVTALVRPLFVKHGIICYPTNMKIEQQGNRTQLTCDVVFQNVDDVGDRMVVSSAGYGIDDQDKGPGKAISYAVKYAYLKGLCLESGDDPDEDQETIAKPAITDPRRGQVEAFKANVSLSSNIDQLNGWREDIRPVLESLAAEYPAYVQEAQSKWKQQAAPLLRKAAAHTNGADPATQ